MEVIPNEPGRKTDFDSIFGAVRHYCVELGCEMIDTQMIEHALRDLKREQSVCVFSEDDIRPTNFGLIKYNQR